MRITVQTTINAPIEKVWKYWTEPQHIVNWTFASDDWEAPYSENDLRIGGKFKTVMSAKDKSSSFDFNGVYTDVKVHEIIAYDIEGGRHVTIIFLTKPDGVEVTETFDAEDINSVELQRTGWQAILENFKKYVASQTP